MALAVLYMFISTDPEKYRLFIWVGVFDLGIAMLVTVISVAQNNINWIQGITGLILNPLFIIVILYGLAKEPEGEIIFVAGQEQKAKEGQELPAHLSGQHPLQGK